MTYYEEFGLSPTSSAEEIRVAYRRLCRMLHPDRFMDDADKALAELQMRRLNDVAFTLFDPGRRAAYNESLSLETVPLPCLPAMEEDKDSWPQKMIFWVKESRNYTLLLAVVSVILISVVVYRVIPEYSQDSTVLPTAQAHAGESMAPAAAVPVDPRPRMLERHAAPLRKKEDAVEPEVLAPLQTVRTESSRPEPVPALTRPPGAPEPERPRAVPVKETMRSDMPVAAREERPADTKSTPPNEVSTAVSEMAAAVPVVPHESSDFSGTWIYGGSGVSGREHGLYPAEYVEVRIERTGDELRGRYRGRYRVSDSALSPEVAFSFHGEPAGEHWTTAWQGADGSRGEVDLKLLTPESREVVWRATRLSRPSSLVSGSASLTLRK